MSTLTAANRVHCPNPETLGKLLRDELDLTEVGPVEEHVGVCPGCQQVLGRLVGSLPDALTPHRRAVDEQPPVLPGYTPLGRIDAGGMGVVWRVRDLQFGRELAVKVIASWACASAGLIERFISEARICAQLTHPFIVPVHSMSRLPDGRPYYTMKLVEGKTLAALLEGKPAPAERRMEFVQIFDKVCQAVAFAHGRGVIHRDLKPGNVMVGAHGEVQLMDWGLAKVLADSETDLRSANGSDSTVIEPEVTEITRTRAGSVLGTAAYMAPEQAQGLVEEVDRRSDVFGLGGILCMLLTGEPPYTGPNAEAVRLRAAEADLWETRHRIRGCDADPELIELAECCLAARKADRPADASVVAAQLEAYQAGVQERLRQAELERAAAQASAAAERTARRRTRALAAAVLALMVLAAGGGLWVQHQAAERQAERTHQENILRQEVAADLEQAIRFRQAGHFEASRRLLEQAQQRLADGGSDELRQGVERSLADTDLAWRLDDARQRASTVVEGKYDLAGAEKDYAAVLAEAGLGREDEDPGEVGARLRACAVRAEVVAALEDWAGMTWNDTRRAWLLAVVRAADPDPDRDRLRQPQLWRDREALTRLVQSPAAAQLAPQLVAALAGALQNSGGDSAPLLRAAVKRHPDDFWLNIALSRALVAVKQWDEEISYRRAALALRPRSSIVHYNLGVVLVNKGQVDEAIGHYEQALRLDPKFVMAHNNLGVALRDKGRVDLAIGHYKEALRLDPKHAHAHNNLGVALAQKGQVEEAIGHFEEALRLDSTYASAHYNLGVALKSKGQVEEAIGHYEEALRLDPNNVEIHDNLGIALTDRGQLDAAIRHFEEASRLDPKHASAHNNLGFVLFLKGQLDRAIGRYEEALRLDSKNPEFHNNLGNALYRKGQMEKAIGHYKEALRHDPKFAKAHYNLGIVLQNQGQIEEAIDHYQQTLRLDPSYAEAHCNLGMVLRGEGRFEDSLAHLQQGHELGSKRVGWRYPSAIWLRDAQRLLLFDRKLLSVQQGEARPTDPAELLGLAEVCVIKKEYAAVARFSADAFAAQPELAEDLRAGHRYVAARAAARAGCGQGQDAARLNDTEKAQLRRQARQWLDADLALRAEQLSRDRRAAEWALRNMLKNPDLTGVRDPAALAQLPEEERHEWKNLWQQLDRLLEKPNK